MMKNLPTILLIAKLLSLACLSSGCIDSPVRAEPSPAAVRAYDAAFAAQAAADEETHDKLNAIGGKLDALLEESLTVEPEAVEKTDTTKPSTAAPEVSTTPSPPARLVTVRGKRVNADTFVAEHYRGRWSHPGTIDKHLVEHGVKADELTGLDNETKEKLHSAIHESETGKTVSKSRIVQRGTVATPQSHCPGGVCPAPQRYGLFGRSWSYSRSRRR